MTASLPRQRQRRLPDLKKIKPKRRKLRKRLLKLRILKTKMLMIQKIRMSVM